MAEDWHTLAGRLRWAIDRQPKQGRRYGLRLFQKRMEDHAPNDVPGRSLSAIQTYLRKPGEPGATEPSLRFIQEAARLLAVREAWLAWGLGAPTEEEEAARRGNPEVELLRISTAVYEALGVPIKLPPGTPTIQHPDGIPAETDRFWGSAVWAPVARQTALRLYQYRPAWDLLTGRTSGASYSDADAADEAFWRAVSETSEAIAVPLHAIGIDASQLDLADIADYVQTVAVALQRVMAHYAPGDNGPESTEEE